MWVPSTTGIPLQGGTVATVNNYDATTNRINGASYDAAGNLVSFTGSALTYDAENRVTGASQSGIGSMFYYYDGAGRRVQEVSTYNTEKVFVYDAFGQLSAEYSVGMSAPPCTTCYIATDHLGSTRLVTDQNGNTVGRHDYLPFGEEIAANTGGRDSTFGTQDFVNQKFTGKERDQETGLDYFGARYYGSALGRWTSPDRINLTSARLINPTNTLNKYIYGGNNPLKYIDRDGEDITIFYRPPSGATFDFGHIFIGAMNQNTGQTAFLDYYPRNGTNSFGSGNGTFNTGDLQSRAAEVQAGKFASLTIQTTPEEAQKVIDQISKMLNGFAPGYSAATNNCTTTCEDVLRELGLDFGDTLPSSYWDSVYRRYSQDAQDNPFKAFPFTSAPQKTGVEYGSPRNLGQGIGVAPNFETNGLQKLNR